LLRPEVVSLIGVRTHVSVSLDSFKNIIAPYSKGLLFPGLDSLQPVLQFLINKMCQICVVKSTASNFAIIIRSFLRFFSFARYHDKDRNSSILNEKKAKADTFEFLIFQQQKCAFIGIVHLRGAIFVHYFPIVTSRPLSLCSGTSR
jgi:hypothetical protein